MRQIVETIISYSDDIPFGVIETKGNLDFIKILNSYPEFVSEKEAFIKNPPLKDPRGRKLKRSDEARFIANLVEGLYLEKGNPPFSSKNREPLIRTIDEGISGSIDFFHPTNGKKWIDVFSALDHKFHIFTQESTDTFLDFFTRYLAFYEKLNNKKFVPFYGRWIKEIAAMYTIYLTGISEEFDEIETRLQSALEEGKKNKPKDFLLRYNTDYVKNHILTNIFIAYGKNKDSVLCKLSEFIKENPSEFAYEKGNINKIYRRYYCAIAEMLCWINNQKCFSFENNDLIQIYSNNDVDYEEKDSKLREFERIVVGKILDLCKPNSSSKLEDDQVKFLLSFLISPSENYSAKFDFKRKVKEHDKNSEKIEKEKEYKIEYDETYTLNIRAVEPYDIVFVDDSGACYRERSLEQVSDSIVKLLRFVIMLIVIYDHSQNDKYVSKEVIIDTINQIMKSFGLLPLPTHTVNSYNDKSFMDFCVIKCIEETFYEDE